MRYQGLLLVVSISVVLAACGGANQGNRSTNVPSFSDTGATSAPVADATNAPQATTATVATSATAATQTNTLSSGDHTRTLTVDGRERSYIVHVPNGYDGTTVYPVVMLFHGGGSNATQWMKTSGLNETADREQFIAVYPNGTGETIEGIGVFVWNGGPRQPYGTDPDIANVDDVGFTGAMLDDLASVVKVDEERIHASGMSGGAIMTYRLACELSDRIAAIATVAGPIGIEACNPTRPVSVIHFHGTADEAAPFNGGQGPLDPSGTDFYSVEHSIQVWVNTNGTDVQPIEETLPDIADDGTHVTRQTYGNGRDGSEVVLVTIAGAGTLGRGVSMGQELEILGASTKDISANDMMWEFFQKHPMN